MNRSSALRVRLVAAGVHAGLSAAIAVLVGLVTLGVWYPGDIGTMAGGRQLFLLVLSVDVVLGPLLTFVVFDRRKPRAELVRDLVTIAALQLGALAYGLYTVYVARPVALVHEGGRFRLVSANDVRREELPEAREEYRSLPLTGPLILGTRPSRSGEERVQSIDLALRGYDLGQRPSYWRPYAESRGAIRAEGRPVADLIRRHPARQAELERTLKSLALPAAEARFLPVVARQEWVAILDAGGDIVGYAPFDGFF